MWKKYKFMSVLNISQAELFRKKVLGNSSVTYNRAYEGSFNYTISYFQGRNVL